MIAVAADVTSTPQAVHFFGKEMVLYRGKGSGRPILLDAFCPHMRVHIAKNTTSYIVRDGMQVEGDSIRCPAHGWRYNSKGQCDDIPYSTHGIPKSACLKSYTVEERAGCIFMWHDMEGGAPDFDLPALSEWDRTGEGWVRWTPDHLGTLPIHPQEILDNMSDIAHFAPVHGSTGTVYFENVYDGPIMRQRFGSGHRTLVDSEALLETDTWYTGPGILLCRMEGKHPSLMMICNTPVKDGEVRVWFAVMAKTPTTTSQPARKRPSPVPTTNPDSPPSPRTSNYGSTRNRRSACCRSPMMARSTRAASGTVSSSTHVLRPPNFKRGSTVRT